MIHTGLSSNLVGQLVSQYFSFCDLQKCFRDLFIRSNKSFLSVIMLELIKLNRLIVLFDEIRSTS